MTGRFHCTESTSHPPGNCPSKPAKVPTLKATPTSVWLQPC